MKKQLGLLFAVIMVLNMAGSVSLARSPLENYNLYDDVMGGGSSKPDPNRERVTTDFYNNSMRPGSAAAAANGKPTEEEEAFAAEEAERQQRAQDIQNILDSVNTGEMVGPRNKDLRASSGRVYSNLNEPEPWASEKSFYSRPSMSGIRENYRKSNFAGALQESISLVNHKGFESLTNEQKTIAYYYLAMSYAKCGQKENAVRAYEKVIALKDCPMIVKYATNGRNCVLNAEVAAPATKTTDGKTTKTTTTTTTTASSEVCYPDVNVPELVYPNAHMADALDAQDLTPVDPQELIDRNMRTIHHKMNPLNNAQADDAGNDTDPVKLPFGKQDSELDKFINAPYGNGLPPEFNEQYKQIQLRTIQKKMNAEGKSEERQNQTHQDVRKLDEKANPNPETDKQSDAGTIKLAYDADAAFEQIKKDPEYIRQQREIEEISRMFDSSDTAKTEDITDLLPYMTEQGDKKLSPEVIQALMMQSMMSNITL